MTKKIFILFLIFASIAGCTRDDICEEGIATTPLLIITFNDIVEPNQRKAVPSLTVETVETNSTQVISATTTDSIAIPLRNTGLQTIYRFKNGVGTAAPNTDVITFNYTTEDIYINRACAFKTVYHDLNARVQDEGSANWILQFEIETTDVIDETETHITIFH
ncbi:MAG: hypothetical protein KJO05_10110 [Bacteroidia bacterium]|nr:hypothetical protein [Bacteroidia bacterium]NNF29903.1 hypothetical protein [Flavobacteriaceae bacterium]MBT8276887.1 hypothetical protein [Bacteroidia bacterium]NNJ81617.1 hypothetical protein [Flavobacteriaceae bacterium]NNK55041.1 hypothetical protein [Flavobacteriaceae bacterium]